MRYKSKDLSVGNSSAVADSTEKMVDHTYNASVYTEEDMVNNPSHYQSMDGKLSKDSESYFFGILKEMYELYNKKNHDYGNSFSETIQEFGFTPAVARINDKLKRVKQMVKGEPMQVKESMRDNLIDIANYCILTIIELDKLF